MPKKFKQAVKKGHKHAALASAQEIWQASLGAFARAQEENALQGVSLRAAGESALPASNDALMPSAGPARDQVEQLFAQRVARALASLGLPGPAELAALYQRIDTLSAQVAALAPAPKRQRAARKLVKPSARKKGASRKQAG